MSSQKDIFIRVIEYAVQRNGSFLMSDMVQSLELEGAQLRMICDQIGRGNLLAHNHRDGSPFRGDPNFANREYMSQDVWCSAIDRFRLLEYQELQEARKSAQDANKQASRALIVAIVAIVISAGAAFWQVTTDVNLPKEHYDALQRIADRTIPPAQRRESVSNHIEK